MANFHIITASRGKYCILVQLVWFAREYSLPFSVRGVFYSWCFLPDICSILQSKVICWCVYIYTQEFYLIEHNLHGDKHIICQTFTGYRKTYDIRCTKTSIFLVSPCSCLYPIHWSQAWSREWRCSWSSADRQCSNFIWVINILLPTKVHLILKFLRVNLYDSYEIQNVLLAELYISGLEDSELRDLCNDMVHGSVGHYWDYQFSTPSFNKVTATELKIRAVFVSCSEWVPTMLSQSQARLLK